MDLLLDPSTGVFSWQAFLAFSTRAISLTLRQKRSLSLLIVSLDSSPAFMASDANELEAALNAVASSLSALTRHGDLVGRQGRRRFAVLAQDAQEAGAIRLVQRLQLTVPAQVSTLNRVVPLTVSIGGATLPHSGRSMEELLRHVEKAVADAIAAGGNQARIRGQRITAPTRPTDAGWPKQAAVMSIDGDEIVVRWREVQRLGSLAFLSSDIEAVAVEVQANSCPICLDVARDVYTPDEAPVLPIIGCTNRRGCLCGYRVVAGDPRLRPPPVRAASSESLELTPALTRAALFASHPGTPCSAAKLARFLDDFPLLGYPAERTLEPGEVAYLTRPLRYAWEPVAAAAKPAGLAFPREETFRGWLAGLGEPNVLPEYAADEISEAVIFLTNWRLLLRGDGRSQNILLADLRSLEYYDGAIALGIAGERRRLVLLLREAIQVGFCLARAALQRLAQQDEAVVFSGHSASDSRSQVLETEKVDEQGAGDRAAPAEDDPPVGEIQHPAVFALEGAARQGRRLARALYPGKKGALQREEWSVRER